MGSDLSILALIDEEFTIFDSWGGFCRDLEPVKIGFSAHIQ